MEIWIPAAERAAVNEALVNWLPWSVVARQRPWLHVLTLGPPFRGVCAYKDSDSGIGVKSLKRAEIPRERSRVVMAVSGTLLGGQGRSSGLLRRDGRAGRCAGQPLPANSAREMASSDEDHRRTHQHRKRSAYDTSRQLSPCHLLHHDTLLSPRGNCDPIAMVPSCRRDCPIAPSRKGSAWQQDGKPGAENELCQMTQLPSAPATRLTVEAARQR
jgi:hypothetical protein